MTRKFRTHPLIIDDSIGKCRMLPIQLRFTVVPRYFYYAIWPLSEEDTPIEKAERRTREGRHIFEHDGNFFS
jgi:hypothetical protein